MDSVVWLPRCITLHGISVLSCYIIPFGFFQLVRLHLVVLLIHTTFFVFVCFFYCIFLSLFCFLCCSLLSVCPFGSVYSIRNREREYKQHMHPKRSINNTNQELIQKFIQKSANVHIYADTPYWRERKPL